MAEWILNRLGPDIPMHLTAFHPDFRMADTPHTPPATLLLARDRMRRAGLHHVYVGNMRDRAAQSTYCTGCEAPVIAREWHTLVGWALDDHGACIHCGTACPGVFDGSPGTWGGRRQRVRIAAP
jgi:pyruvate formate lyase activating enzyme